MARRPWRGQGNPAPAFRPPTKKRSSEELRSWPIPSNPLTQDAPPDPASASIGTGAPAPDPVAESEVGALRTQLTRVTEFVEALLRIPAVKSAVESEAKARAAALAQKAPEPDAKGTVLLKILHGTHYENAEMVQGGSATTFQRKSEKGYGPGSEVRVQFQLAARLVKKKITEYVVQAAA